ENHRGEPTATGQYQASTRQRTTQHSRSFATAIEIRTGLLVTEQTGSIGVSLPEFRSRSRSTRTLVPGDSMGEPAFFLISGRFRFVHGHQPWARPDPVMLVAREVNRLFERQVRDFQKDHHADGIPRDVLHVAESQWLGQGHTAVAIGLLSHLDA